MLTLLNGPSESRRCGIAGVRDVGEIQNSAVVIMLNGGHCSSGMMAPDIDQDSVHDRRRLDASGVEARKDRVVNNHVAVLAPAVIKKQITGAAVTLLGSRRIIFERTARRDERLRVWQMVDAGRHQR